MRTRFTEDEIERIKSEYPTCLDLDALARDMGRSKGSIYKKASDLGVNRQCKMIDKVCAILAEDPLMDTLKICDILGVKSPQAIYGALARSWGVSLKDLRREVFQKHYRRIPTTESQSKPETETHTASDGQSDTGAGL